MVQELGSLEDRWMAVVVIEAEMEGPRMHCGEASAY